LAPADIDALRRLFARASARLQAPRVHLVAGNLQVRLAPAGVLSRHPTSIYVSARVPASCNEGVKIDASHEGEKINVRSWLGRIAPSGVFLPARTTHRRPGPGHRVGDRRLDARTASGRRRLRARHRALLLLRSGVDRPALDHGRVRPGLRWQIWDTVGDRKDGPPVDQPPHKTGNPGSRIT